ncbi:quinolinate synthase NadA [Robertkochia marina]|uniref:Quinolinate synthase n=1 Tax=Robertkochia marina TaxID=1227945 RepID=A0A4S3LXK1_9FLAO|nr:quinolinate synthase NadA [Robertkochia marina]THD66279.1 quinolinate synthase NadA [Robertkochia marina]TRZ41200.1 quinolinate synthase NadA [Robertkochia marina]
MDLAKEISRLKQEKNAVILAHYYQIPEIQDLADYVGDSLGLSRVAAETTADMIVFAGVHFMAETAKILNPDKKVVLPDLNAGCSLADSCHPDDFETFIKQHPDHTVITYVNCSAGIKALSDVVCTSSNAITVVNSIPEDQPIIFAPDRNLGKYIISKTGRDMKLWDGSCMVHEAFSLEKLNRLRELHPDAVIIAHPESESHILATAAYIGSTAGMIKYIKDQPEKKYLVGTEAGILHQLRKEVPGTQLIPLPVSENNSCACSECAYMKLNTLQKLHACLQDETPEIVLDKALQERALQPIERMLELS